MKDTKREGHGQPALRHDQRLRRQKRKAAAIVTAFLTGPLLYYSGFTAAHGELTTSVIDHDLLFLFLLVFQVGPRDGGYGIGRYRLALESGATDCSFRILFWNRSATAQASARDAEHKREARQHRPS